MSSYGFGLRSINGGHARFGAGTYPLTQKPAPFISDSNVYSTQPVVTCDHVCRPVAVDAYGRPIPGVIVVPADQRVTTEYVTEHVYSTLPNQHQNAVDPLNCDNGKCMPLFSEQVLPNKVNEFVTTVQTEASSGHSRARGFPTDMFQRRAAASRNWQTGGTEKPPPVRSYENTMTRPSNDIGAMAEYMKESARPKLGKPSEKIDHIEAKRRYGNAPPTGTERTDSYLSTIDSKAAALKYNGALVNY